MKPTGTPRVLTGCYNIQHFALGAVLFLGALALFLPQSLAGINTFDEGFIMSGAMLILEGELPYKDFFSLYGPGQYYMTAALFLLFGETLLVVHLAHAVLLAGQIRPPPENSAEAAYLSRWWCSSPIVE